MIRGDGSWRGDATDQTGTILVFDLPTGPVPSERAGIGIKACSDIRFENLTIQGAPDGTDTNSVIGVNIESIDGVLGTTAIEFHNVTFRWCSIGVRTNFTNNNSELAFYGCCFTRCKIGFQALKSQSLVHKFIGCVGGGSAADNEDPYQGMDTMFDLTAGGNITVIGFGGQNIKTFVKVGQGGGNIGWNLFHNIRLEQMARDVTPPNTWGNSHRTKLYEAVQESGASSGQRTEFNGVVLIPPGAGTPKDDGTARFSLLDGHMVVLRNASRAASADYQLATVTSKLVEFKTTGGTRGGTFRAFNVQVPFDARLNRNDVPAIGRYSFTECNDDNVPYPDLLHPPLYGPNYLMSVESHCWVAGDGQTGVNAATAGAGLVAPVAPSDVLRAGVLACRTEGSGDVASLVSSVDAVRFGGGVWRFQASVRIPTLSDGTNTFTIRLGFGDDGEGEPDDGLYFSYTHSANSGKWRCILREGGSNTTTENTDEVVDTGWHTFEIEVDGGDTPTATFYIDGVEVAQTDAPTDPVGLLPLQIERTAGVSEAGRSAQIDYFKYTFRPSEPGTMYPE